MFDCFITIHRFTYEMYASRYILCISINGFVETFEPILSLNRFFFCFCSARDVQHVHILTAFFRLSFNSCLAEILQKKKYYSIAEFIWKINQCFNNIHSQCTANNKNFHYLFLYCIVQYICIVS